MDLSLSPALEQIRAELRKFLHDEVIPWEKEAAFDPDQGFPPELVARVRHRAVALGFYGAEMPHELGGKGLGLVGLCLLEEETAQADTSLGGFILGNLGGPGRLGSLFLLCTEEQKRHFVQPLIKGEKTCCFALTEPTAGSDAASIATTAARDSHDFILNGRKSYITWGPYADIAVVLAVVPPSEGKPSGITAFFVEKETPGYRVGQIQNSMAGGHLESELFFKDCRLPAGNVIGDIGKGLGAGLERINRNRIRLGATCVGLAERLLRLAVGYAKERVTFGQLLAEHELIQAMVADMATEIYAARCMVYDAAWHADQGVNVRQQAAMVKVFTTEMAGHVADRALQIHGARAYMRGHPVERLYRQVRGYRLAVGSSEIQRITIARGLLAEKGAAR